MLIEDVKVKELVYSGNTVIFLLPNRECCGTCLYFVYYVTILQGMYLCNSASRLTLVIRILTFVFSQIGFEIIMFVLQLKY